MSRNDPKYKFVGGKIVNIHTGDKIPDHEPVFIMRAKDLNAVPALRAYARLCKDTEHHFAVQECIVDFTEFERRNPSKMHEPDTFTEESGAESIVESQHYDSEGSSTDTDPAEDTDDNK